MMVPSVVIGLEFVGGGSFGLGAQSNDVLREAGLSVDEIARLRAKGVVG